MDAITLLKRDHQAVEKLFKRFEKAGDGAHVEKRAIVDQIIEELSKHAAIEEQLLYPVARATVPDTEDIALESLEEHHVVKWLLSEVDSMDPSEERFDAKVTVLIENVRHHVEEEEEEFFPKLRDELGRNALGELGDALEKAKAVAPTHPHPRAPDTPPGNLVMGTAAGVVDRVGDAVSGLAEGGVAAVQDVISRVMGTKKQARVSRASTTAGRVARSTRSGADDLTDDVADAARAARRRARRAARTTKKRAGTARRKVAGATKKTARKATRATQKRARKATRATKKTARKATGTTKKTARKATRATKKTGRRASGTAKKTGTRARKAAKRTTR